MNKQEAMKRIEQMGEYEPFVDEAISKKSVLNIISQIHEPQKVVVPKFVAEWIERHKKSFSDASAIDMYDNLTSDNKSGYYHEVWLWVNAHHHDFIRAWHDGYEVEKEKLYTVIIPHSQNHRGQVQYLCKQGKNWFFCGNDINRFKTKFTKVQIEEAGFGWVFDCNGVKVAEVE